MTFMQNLNVITLLRWQGQSGGATWVTVVPLNDVWCLPMGRGTAALHWLSAGLCLRSSYLRY